MGSRQTWVLLQGGKTSLLSDIMKTFVFLFFVGLSAAATVKRDAEPDAEADPSGYRTGGYSSAPVCTETPVKECKPRQIENPRKVCQTVIDTHEDTVVTEHCEEVITTQCTQTSQSATQHSAVVDQSTRLVETGVPRAVDHSAHAVVAAPAVAVGPTVVSHAVAAPAVVGHAVGGLAVGGLAVGGASYGVGHHYKREADADADADASYGYGVATAGYVAPVAKQVSAPVCNSVPTKKCNKVPHSTPRKVARTVCDTVVDVTTIQDCHETVTRVCQQTSTSHASHSAVVGHDTKVVATNENVAHHGTVAVGATVHGAPVVSAGVVGAGVSHGVVGAGVVSHGVVGGGVVSAGYHH